MKNVIINTAVENELLALHEESVQVTKNDAEKLKSYRYAPRKIHDFHSNIIHKPMTLEHSEHAEWKINELKNRLEEAETKLKELEARQPDLKAKLEKHKELYIQAIASGDNKVTAKLEDEEQKLVNDIALTQPQLEAYKKARSLIANELAPWDGILNAINKSLSRQEAEQYIPELELALQTFISKYQELSPALKDNAKTAWDKLNLHQRIKEEVTNFQVQQPYIHPIHRTYPVAPPKINPNAQEHIEAWAKHKKETEAKRQQSIDDANKKNRKRRGLDCN